MQLTLTDVNFPRCQLAAMATLLPPPFAWINFIGRIKQNPVKHCLKDQKLRPVAVLLYASL